jgi:site-specific DNA recombinase
VHLTYCRICFLTRQTEVARQVNYYTTFITNHPDYSFAGIYADEGISGTNTKKRDQFNKMIDDCRSGKIDMVITKSISRFARNTLDCLNFVRLLKDLGIGVIFEKENINTLDGKGEVLLSILSSLAQDESRSISENSTWGIRRRFEQGKQHVNHTKFLGYDKDENGELIINEEQAKIVRRIYTEYLDGKGPNRIAKDLEKEKVPKWDGTSKWYESTVRKILINEKYKGDALLQKTYTVDFLSKKRADNNGEVPQYYVENSHPAIIDKDVWDAVQLEAERRRAFAKEHQVKRLEFSSEKHPFAGRVICGRCGKTYGRKVWNSPNERLRRIIWQCNNKYLVKGEKGCESKHIDDKVLYQAFVNTFNAVVENREQLTPKWQRLIKEDDILKRIYAERFLAIFSTAEPIGKFDFALYYKLVEKITVQDEGRLIVALHEGTEIEYEIK